MKQLKALVEAAVSNPELEHWKDMFKEKANKQIRAIPHLDFDKIDNTEYAKALQHLADAVIVSGDSVQPRFLF